MIKKICILFLFCIHFGCTSDKFPSHTCELPWDEISIRLYGQSINIIKEDSAIYSDWKYKDSTTENGIYHNRVNLKTKKFFLTKEEQDSLYYYAYEQITKPTFVSNDFSCFHCDDLLISIRNRKSHISCGYSSVSPWTKITPTITKIHRILKTKVDINGN